jgi:muramoyltetrapeptide carboxypeptidase
MIDHSQDPLSAEPEPAEGRDLPSPFAPRFAQALQARFKSVELLALSGRVHDWMSFERGVQRFQGTLPVRHVDCASLPYQRFAASDAQRLAWINSAAADAQSSLLLGVRGGFGVGRLLDGIDYAAVIDRMNAAASVLCAHSDFTALQLALMAHAQQSGQRMPLMLQGPMLCVDFGLQAPLASTLDHFVAAISGADASVDVPGLRCLVPGDCPPAQHGVLWGGNLSMICSLLGTRYWPDVQGGILFIEDVNEHPYRIERMLLQLAQAGVLEQQLALVVGACSDWKPSPWDEGYDLDAALCSIAQHCGVPVLTGLSFGHVPEKLSLPVGQMASLTPAAGGHMCLRFSGL